jgi:hypothetical protein
MNDDDDDNNDDDAREAVEAAADRLNPDHAVRRRQEQAARRQRLNAGMVEIPGLRPVGGTMFVWPVDDWRLAPGWTLVSADIGLKSGSPLGALTFARDSDPTDTVDVAVRWNFHHGQLECSARTTRLTDTERQQLEADSRHRVAAYVAACAHVGSRAVGATEALAAIHAAAGLSQAPHAPSGSAD